MNPGVIGQRIGRRRSHRWMRIGAVCAGVLCIMFSLVGATSTERARSRAAHDHSLTLEARERADRLLQYFERARAVTLVTANNPGFEGFYRLSGDRLANVHAGGQEITQATAALRFVETMYPDEIEEVCFIDLSGAENARVVKGQVAPADELSSDESANDFFTPTLQLSPGTVFQGLPYVSPDTKAWVISNSTLVTNSAGDPEAIVHFEVSVDSFREGATHEHADVAYLIVDGRTGQVISDSRVPQLVDGRLGVPSDRRFLQLGTPSPDHGMITVGKERAAFQQVETTAENLNDWYVVAVGPVTQLGILGGISPTAIASLTFGLMLLILAVAETRANRRRLQVAADTDPLTGLPNRALFAERAKSALSSSRTALRTAVLLVDLDRFKEINDTLGHGYGDEVLVAVGPRLRDVMRASDTVARLGGDEFGILLTNIRSAAEAMVMADRLQRVLCEPYHVGGLSLEVEASVGVAVTPQHGTDFDELLQHADVAMYVAKESRCGVALYDPAHDHNSTTRLSLLGDLRGAVEHHELELLYQPKRSLDDHAIRSVEALIRWNHSVLGRLAPSDFIDIAERSALIGPMTVWILERAVRQLREWLDAGIELPVSVNVSARSMDDPGFVSLISEILHRYRVPSRLLAIEITETTLMNDTTRTRLNLAGLDQLGVEICIDDFGTGYSSLGYLSTLKVHELKIDQSFVIGMTANRTDQVIVRSLIELGHSLGLRVVAEGVQDAETAGRLARAGCDLAQGYHWDLPQLPQAISAMLTEQPAIRHS